MVSFKVAATALATTAIMATNTSAMVQHPKGVVDRVALYKNVRKLINSKNIRGRDLQDTTTKLTTTCFTTCLAEHMTADQCVAYIEEEIAKAGGHEAGNVEVAVQTPRDPVVLSETYWMAEVPTNIQGQVACDLHGGNVQYPYPWDNPSAGGEGVPVPPVPCQGKTAGDCCLAIRREGQTSSLGGKDANGQCLACFPHQELLVPVPGSGSSGSSPEYKDYTWDGSACVPTTLTLEQVTADDQAKAAGISAAAQALKDFLDAPSPPSCSEFETLLGQLYDASVTLPALPQMIGELSCMVCYEPEQVVFEPTPETTAITDAILATMAEAPAPISSQPTVVIYTDSDGTIQEVPKLGGTRADDEVTDDCPDEDGGAPPTTGGGTGEEETPTTGEEETPTTGDGETPTTGDGETPTTGDGETPTTGDGETPTTGDGETPTTGDGETPTTGDETPPEPAGNSGWNLPPSGTDRSSECFTPANPVPDTYIGIYEEPREGHVCHEDPDKFQDVTDEGLGYSIEHINRSYDNENQVTQFLYKVCTVPTDCGRRERALKGKGGGGGGAGGGGQQLNRGAAISHVTIGILGSCIVTSAGMFTVNGSSTNDFGSSPAYGVGPDPTTCLAGFKFDSGWDSVKENGCGPEGFCRQLMIEVAGDIPEGEYMGAVKASTGFTKIKGLAVPDCSVECN